MESVYKGIKAILLFLIMIILIQTILGDKATENFTILLLFTMVILNSDYFVKVIESISSNLTDNIKNGG